MFLSTDQVKATVFVISVVVIVLIAILIPFISELTTRVSPIQHEQVKIIGKRTATSYRSGAKSTKPSKIPNCIVAFKFSDGTE